MALHPAEESTLCAFVIPSKRERLVYLFGTPKRRRKALNTLSHFTDCDTRFAEAVDPATDVLALLRDCGAPSECHVISEDPALDGRDMPLIEAVEAADSFDFGSILCCVPGQLAFYFGEKWHPRPYVLLRRPAMPSAMERT